MNKVKTMKKSAFFRTRNTIFDTWALTRFKFTNGI